MVIKIGLMFYDSFTRKQKTVPTHKFYIRTKALGDYPYLNDKIKYAALYYDGQLLSPERMTVEIILDGKDEGNHAKALNYVPNNFARTTGSLLSILLVVIERDVDHNLLKGVKQWITGRQ